MTVALPYAFSTAIASRIRGYFLWKDAAVIPLRTDGLPSAKALQFATDAVCRVRVLPETELHPEIGDQALQLAYLLTAYGLVPAS